MDTVVFLHGTTVRDTTSVKDALEKGLAQALRERTGSPHPTFEVLAPTWGATRWPENYDILTALPPATTRGTGEQPEAADVWAALAVDPLLELDLIALTASASTEGLVIGRQLPGARRREVLQGLVLQDDEAARLGVSPARFSAAVTTVLGSAELAAVDASGADVADVDAAVARAVAAAALADPDADPGAGRPASVREEVAQLVVDALGASATRALPAPVLRLLQRIGTSAAVSRRRAFMPGVARFGKDITSYLSARTLVLDEVREHVLAARRAEGRLVLLGHSLGGILAFDLLTGADAPHVDALVTVGTQISALHVMESLWAFPPGGRSPALPPWLNVYDRQDLLSFCMDVAFGVQVDREVHSGGGFPAAHGAYFTNPDFYRLVVEHLHP